MKSINNFLDNNSKQLDQCRSHLVSTTTMEECQGFINKVRELRHSKIRNKQINKLNSLVEKQEGRLVNSSNIPYSQLGLSPGTSTLGDTTNSQPREAAVSSLSSSAQGDSSTLHPGDTADSAQGVTA